MGSITYQMPEPATQVKMLDIATTVEFINLMKEGVKLAKVDGAVRPLAEALYKSAYAAGRVAGLEAAAEAIDDECRERIMTASDCIDAIRNLKETP